MSPKDGEHAGPVPDDVKAKFRQALDRKQGRHDEHDEGRPRQEQTTHTGPAKVQRQFRRKSG